MNDVQPSSYPVRVELDFEPRGSRVLAALGILFFVKALLLLPHIVVMWFLGVASALLMWINCWVVLVTGERSKPLCDFVLGVTRWQTRMNGWLCGLTDRYPPFSLE